MIVNVQLRAQTIDSSSTLVSYKLTYLSDSTKPQKAKIDIVELSIGDKISTFYSYMNFKSDSLLKADISNGVITLSEYAKNRELQAKYPRSGSLNGYQLYFNFPENKITTTDMIFSGKYLFEEEIEEMHWKILGDTMRILNYLCQKAFTSFRGRSYVAWFTSEVPLHVGPYKFRGLPGLIIKLADIKDNFVYECIGIRQLIVKQPIILNSKDFIKTTRKDYRRLLKAGFENPYQALDIENNITVNGKGADELKTALQKALPFNPIELE